MKPHVSPSQLSTMEKCGEMWRIKYIERIRTTPNENLVGGSACHAVAEWILRQNVLLSMPEKEAVEERARVLTLAQIRKDGVKVIKGLSKSDKSKFISNMQDYVSAYSLLYLQDIAPIIKVESVDDIEREFYLDIDGFDFDVNGHIDVVERGGFRDLKTAGKKPSQSAIDTADQYTFYALWYYHEFGEMPKIYQDTIVKTKSPYISIIETERDYDDFKVIFKKLENFSKITESGVFHHASNMGWWCSSKFCDFYNECKYTRNPKSITVGDIGNEQQCNKN